MADADSRAGILAGRQFAFGRNDLVQQHRVGHELVVVGGFGVLEDVAQLFEVRGAQVERHVGISLFRKQFEALGVDLEDFASVALDDLHVLLRQKTVLGFVFPHGERLLINKVCHSVICMLFVLCCRLRPASHPEQGRICRQKPAAMFLPVTGKSPQIYKKQSGLHNYFPPGLLFFSQKTAVI